MSLPPPGLDVTVQLMVSFGVNVPSLLTALLVHPVTADTIISAAIAITILLFFIIKYLLKPCS